MPSKGEVEKVNADKLNKFSASCMTGFELSLLFAGQLLLVITTIAEFPRGMHVIAVLQDRRGERDD
jgi:hypothetical protein